MAVKRVISRKELLMFSHEGKRIAVKDMKTICESYLSQIFHARTESKFREHPTLERSQIHINHPYNNDTLWSGNKHGNSISSAFLNSFPKS